MNDKGPRIGPWGTPHTMFLHTGFGQSNNFGTISVLYHVHHKTLTFEIKFCDLPCRRPGRSIEIIRGRILHAPGPLKCCLQVILMQDLENVRVKIQTESHKTMCAYS